MRHYARMRKSLGRSLGVLVFVLVLVSAGYWFYRLLAGKGVAWAGDFGSAVSMFTGLFALLFPVAFWLTRRVGGPEPVSRPDTLQARDDLAVALRQQWKKEEQLRRVNDPRPLPVRWTVTSRAWDAMPGTPVTALGDPAGLSDRFDGIADTFNGVRSRRLVILGEAGAGKSVLVMKLAAELLSVRRGDMPLPVIVPASAWDPDQSLFDWIADQLAQNYSGLAVPVKSSTGEVTTLASTLVRAGVIPIVDGLDELPPARRGDALAQLNAAGSDFPLVVTSRPDEYLDAVAESGRGISEALVVEMLPLRPAEIKAYLREATAATVDGRWHGVFERMDGEPNGLLARALATPLMLWLARTVYERGSSDPGELLDQERFGDRETIENHLLDAFVPAVYAKGRPEGTGFDCTSAQAQRWLAYLASRASSTGSPGIVWWRLGLMVRSTALITVFRALLLFNVWWWLALRLVTPYVHRNPGSNLRGRVRDIAFDGTVGHYAWPYIDRALRSGMSFLYTISLDSLSVYPWKSLVLFEVLLAALAFGGAILNLASTNEASWVDPKTLRFRVMSVAGKAAETAVSLSGVALLILILPAFFSSSPEELRHLGGVLGEPSTWLVVLLFGLCGLPSIPSAFVAALDVSGSRGPGEVLRSDRRAGAVRAVSEKILLAVTLYLWCGPAVISAYGVYALVATTLDVSLGGMTPASRKYAEARIVLSCGRLMPWRMMSFLVDAHRRGALRQVGAVYEFRHIRLRQRLAARHHQWPERLQATAFIILGERASDAVRRSVHRAAMALKIPPTDATDTHGLQVTNRGLVRVYRDPRFDRRIVAWNRDDDITE